MEAAALGHALDRQDLPAAEVRRQGEAGEHGLAVHEHRAGAALAELAAVLRADQAEILAQYLEEGLVDRHEHVVRLAVDRQGEPALHPYSCPGGG